MDSSYARLLERTRLPQPSLQRYAVISLFDKLRSAPPPLGLSSAPGCDALSQCLRSSSAAAVDQAVRELCRLVRDGRLAPAAGLLELQSALEGCEPPLASLFVKGIGFLSRLAFQKDSSYGRLFDPVELHPFVKVLSCRAEVQNELIQQVLLFIVHVKSVGMEAVSAFLRPFLLFCIIRSPFSTSSSSFVQDLFTSIASLSCSFPSEATSIIKLLTECLEYFPCTSEEEFKHLVSSAEYLADAVVFVMKETAGTDTLAMDVQACCMKLLHSLLLLCTYLHKLTGGTEIVLGLSKRLLVAQKELDCRYLAEFSSIILYISIILTEVKFEHEHLSILKLLIFLVEWKTEYEHDTRAACCLSEELLFVFPVINILASPSQSVTSAATYLLSLVEHHILDLAVAPKKSLQVCTMGSPSISNLESILSRLFNHLWTQEQSPSWRYYFIGFCSSLASDAKVINDESNCWTSQLREQLLSIITKAKCEPHSKSRENRLAGVSLLMSSVVSILVMHPTHDALAVDSLAPIGVMDPSLGMTLFLASLFYIKMLCGCESKSPRILLKLLELLPQLASHSIMAPLIIQSLLPMIHIGANRVLYAAAVRLLCKTWMITDRAFETLQEILDPRTSSGFVFDRDISISIAASIRDICKHNPDRGVDLILCVSSCIESRDSTVQAVGFESLAYLCEADVIDFYTAWDVISKHMLDYCSDPVVAYGLCTLLRWGAMDAETYSEAAKAVIQILWNVGTSRSSCSGSLWARARALAYKSLSQYEVKHVHEAIPDFQKQNFEYLISEDDEEVLKAMEGLQIKILTYEHINRRRVLKEKRVMVHKVEKLLDVFPRIMFPPGKQNIFASELPGASLLSFDFTPKDLQGHATPKDLPKLHAVYENALVEAAQSLNVPRNILFAMLALQSWKSFAHRWVRAASTLAGAKVPSDSDDKISKAANGIFKIMCKVALESIPRVAVNIALALGALCKVLPPVAHATISAASEFLLNWLFEDEHEHHQWSAAISLGLISTCFHPTDSSQKSKVISGLLQTIRNSKSHFVKGACGVGLGFASQGLFARAEVNETSDFEEEKLTITESDLLQDIIRTLYFLLCQLCPTSSDSFKNLNKCFPLGLDDAYGEEASNMTFENSVNLEEDIWGVAGLVIGLGNSVPAIYRYGAYDAVIKIKDMFISWVPNSSLSVNTSFLREDCAEVPLLIGSCLALPTVVAFCQRAELMDNSLDSIFSCYYILISELLESKKSGTLFHNLLMSSSVGAGSLLSFIISEGGHTMRFDDVKCLLEKFRTTYLKSNPPIVHFCGMLGIVNTFGAGVGDLIHMYPQYTSLQINHEQDSSVIRGPILSNPACEPLSTLLIQEIFLVAKESKDHYIRSYAAWALSFLRQKWWSKDIPIVNGSDRNSSNSVPSSQNFSEDSLVWKSSLWLQKMNSSGIHLPVVTVAIVLRCLSKAPRLPTLDWGAIIRYFMRYKVQSSVPVHVEQVFKLLREECIHFSVAHANNVSPLMLFLDELTDLARFRMLELNLQALLLQHLSHLMKIFSGLRLEKLYEDLIVYFSSSVSPYTAYKSEQKSFLRISFWKGLYPFLAEAPQELVYVPKMERCMKCFFLLLPLVTFDGSSVKEHARSEEEWSEATRCLASARQDWLINLLQISDFEPLRGRSHTVEYARQITARARLVRIGYLSFSELGKSKAYLFNITSEGFWWTVLVEVIAAVLSATEVGIYRQWLLDAVEISCTTEYPSTALRFVGLLAGCCCKYMPLLVMDPIAVLSDLPVTLPSLLLDGNWASIADSLVDKLWVSTERICKWALQSASSDCVSIQDQINPSESQMSSFLAQLMHRTCVSLKDYLPMDKQLRLAMLSVP